MALPNLITIKCVLGRITFPQGQAVQRAVKLAYDTRGNLTEIDGPREDVDDTTRIKYYGCEKPTHCDQIQQVTNALGQSVVYEGYDALGRVTRTRAPNGLVTEYHYHPRGWLLRQTQTVAGQAPVSPGLPTTPPGS